MNVMQHRLPSPDDESVAGESASERPTEARLLGLHCRRSYALRSHWLIRIYATATFLVTFLTILAVLPVDCHGYGYGGAGALEIHHPVRRRHSSSVDAGDKTLPNGDGVATPPTLSKPADTVEPSSIVVRRCPVRSRPEMTQDANSTSWGSLVSPEGAVPVGSGWCRCLTTAGVEEIRCTGGGMKEVPDFEPVDRVFGGLYAVRQSINGLRQAAFGTLKVEKISLNFNPIGDALSENAMSGLGRHLRELSLGACSIRSLPKRLLAGLDKLTSLHLWSNRIHVIPQGFFGAESPLRELVLWGNEISHVDENTFGGLWNLTRLDLDRNRIKKLDKETFRHLGKLQVLYLGNNHIKAVLSDTFLHMHRLRVMRLDGNDIEFVWGFKNLYNLQSLSLERNNLSQMIDGVFTELRNLTTLQLSRNKLELIRPAMFAGLKSLIRLDLSDNRISSVPPGSFRNLTRLRHLRLDGNRLVELRRCAVSKRVHLRSLSVVGNPIRCIDCCGADVLSWFVELHRTGETKVNGACLWSNPSIQDSGAAIEGSRARSGTGFWAPLVANYSHQRMALAATVTDTSCSCPQNSPPDCKH